MIHLSNATKLKLPLWVMVCLLHPLIHSVEASEQDQEKTVLNGIDVLVKNGFRPLRGSKVGLITNHTGIDRNWVSTVELLNKVKGVELVALFSPEHGFEGKLDVAKINDSRESQTGLKIHSLYGKTRTPTAEMLKGIDTLVFDIQDIGTRFYTYVSTMGNAMRAAAQHKIRFVVLDRPNPINGFDFQGPVLDQGAESFVGYHRVPVRHGMTVGELATMFNHELKLGVELQIIKMEGWHRNDYLDATGLPWINPSPNMRNLTQAVLYPGVGLLEMTNLSVGRGTDSPFEVIGAPFIDGVQLAAALNSKKLKGVRFVPIRFTPASSKFKGERCGGVNLIVTDRKIFHPIRTGLQLASTLHQLYPQEWQTDQLNRLLSHQQTFRSLLAGKPVKSIQQDYQKELESFEKRRRKYLLYPQP